jgi:predicted RNA-binding protein
MCQATVYLVQHGQEQEIMRDVILLEPAENGVRLASFFEEPQVVDGRVRKIDFLKHRVLLEPLEEEKDAGD